MAYYKYPEDVGAQPWADFDATNARHPATAAPYSGIYKCTGCGYEAVSTKGHPLPPQNHHQHTNRAVPVLWRLVVMATHS